VSTPSPEPETAPDAAAAESADDPRTDRHAHLPAGAHVGDKRGLTALGAVTVALGLGMLGGAVDVVTGSGLRTVFAVCFVVGCGLAALLVHREDLRAAVVMPPLVYVALALLAGAVERAGDPGSFVGRQALELVNALVLGAPVLLTATAVAVVVALARAVLGDRLPQPWAVPAALRSRRSSGGSANSSDSRADSTSSTSP
jgi:hypothetical protein